HARNQGRSMVVLVLGLMVFLGAHSIAIVAPQWRDRMALRLGPQLWRGLYSVVSLAGFLLLIHGFALARATPVYWYFPAAGLRAVTRVLMLPVFPLLLAAYLPGRIQAAVKHPMLAAVKLWAFAHLLSNGSAAGVVLFGSVLIWAVADRISFKRRPAPPVRGAAPSRWNDLIAIVLGLALYWMFMNWAHLKLIGVAPQG
ncbi:MAG TPA: NnrU family protein, partial [Steroidobacteraceae bacterium]|nr:NnrU family protein [Steroidobacteraceae bacterium]